MMIFGTSLHCVCFSDPMVIRLCHELRHLAGSGPSGAVTSIFLSSLLQLVVVQMSLAFV